MDRNRAWKEQSWRHLLGEMSKSESRAFKELLRADTGCKAVYRECAELLADYAEVETFESAKPDEEIWEAIEAQVNGERRKPRASSMGKFFSYLIRSAPFWGVAACLLLMTNVFLFSWNWSLRQDVNPPSLHLADTASSSSFGQEHLKKSGVSQAMLNHVKELERDRDELARKLSLLEEEFLAVSNSVAEARVSLGSNGGDRPQASVFVMNGEGGDKGYGDEIWSYLKTLRQEPGVSLAFAAERTRDYIDQGTVDVIENEKSEYS